MNLQPVAGSQRPVLAGAVAVGPVDPVETAMITVVLRAPATTKDFLELEGFAATHALRVSNYDMALHHAVLHGSLAALQDAFGVELKTYRHRHGHYRGRVGPVQVPAHWHDRVQAVLGLDTRPQAMPRFRAVLQEATSVSYWPQAIASRYQFPPGTGHGQTVAVIELAGGYVAAQLHTYWSRLGLTSFPQVVAVPTTANRPIGDPNSADGEVVADIEVLGALLPQAKLVVAFGDNTDQGFYQAFVNAIKAGATVISCSWGAPETSWTAQAMTAYNQLFATASARNVTLIAAAGDEGSRDGTMADTVDFPASAPYVLAVGGTKMPFHGAETVWNDGSGGGATGGGVSRQFGLPSWQNHGLHVESTDGTVVPLTRRGVPDVAGVADPLTGWNVIVDNVPMVIGGTSLPAPGVWAALVARINAMVGQPIGLIQPVLYKHPEVFTRITSGNNGDYQANRAGWWSACTGLGTPNGTQLAALFAKTSPAAATMTDDAAADAPDGIALADIPEPAPGWLARPRRWWRWLIGC